MSRGKLTGRVRMVERLGPTLAKTLSNPTPWTSSHCGRVGCPPCRSKEGSCKGVGVTYQWTCTRCAEEGKFTWGRRLDPCGMKDQHSGSTGVSITQLMRHHNSLSRAQEAISHQQKDISERLWPLTPEPMSGS